MRRRSAEQVQPSAHRRWRGGLPSGAGRPAGQTSMPAARRWRVRPVRRELARGMWKNSINVEMFNLWKLVRPVDVSREAP